ncbi:MAG: RluA family pseudouridine synthase [Halothiobacillaceae bacterium]
MITDPAIPLPGYNVLYEDEDLLVVDKPSRMLTQPGVGPGKDDSLITRIQRELPQARVVHRLDWDTSGLLLIALHAAAHRALSIQFQERKIEKAYIAVVYGHFAEPTGTIHAPLGPDRARPPRHCVTPTGRPSLTHWEVIAQEGAYTRVLLHPMTGRSHQLRVHMLHLGHPILGDTLYAPPKIQAAAPRLLLHAARLGFVHPRCGRAMFIESPAPF